MTEFAFSKTFGTSLGIRTTIDFAFQKTFGSIENKICLISLLNSILDLARPIVDVTLESPFNMKDFDEDKLSIVDVKARDNQGAVFHIAIQLSTPSRLVNRMVFYGCELYADQLRDGESYIQLRPVWSICLLNGTLWQDSRHVHHRFQLTDQASGRVLDETLKVHKIKNISLHDAARRRTITKWSQLKKNVKPLSSIHRQSNGRRSCSSTRSYSNANSTLEPIPSTNCHTRISSSNSLNRKF